MNTLTAFFLFFANTFLLLNNLGIQHILLKNPIKRRNYLTIILLAIFFLGITILTSFTAVRQTIPWYYLILFLVQYASVAIIPMMLFTKCVKQIMYTSLFIIFSDSLCSSSLYILLRTINKSIDKNLSTSLLSLFSQMATLAFLYFCSKKNYYQRFQKNISMIGQKVLILILFLLVILSGLSSSLSVDTNQSDMKMLYIQTFVVILVILSLILIAVLLFNSISKRQFELTTVLLEDKMRSQLRFYEMMDLKDDEMRKFRHDFRKHMMCVLSMVDCGEYADAKKYLNELFEQFHDANPKFKTGNYIADSILTDKLHECVERGIQFGFKGVIPQENLSPLDLCIIFSNALDNAIEACIKITEQNREIKMVSDFKNHYWYLKIVNSSSTQNDIINNHIASTKSDSASHGFGLENIRKSVNKYNGEFAVSNDNGYFTLEATLNIK